MPRSVCLAMLFGSLLSAQSIVPALDFHVPARATLACEITPIKPALTFALQLRAGYRIRIPTNQFASGGHNWRVLVRVTPDVGARDPVYLSSDFEMGPKPETKLMAEITGGFLVGEGSYSGSLVLTDDLGRASAREWQFRARFDTEGGVLRGTLAPGTVAELSATPQPQRPPIFGRLTVLLHIATAVRNAQMLEEVDLQRALAQLAALLEQAPARSVQLLVFNLDQDKVVFRADPFHWDDIARAAGSLSALQLNTVDYRVLQRSGGGVLIDLINRESRASPLADAVIFLGPYRPSAAQIYPGELAQLPRGPRYFYIRYTVSGEDWTAQMQACVAAGGRAACPQAKVVPASASPDAIGAVIAMLHGTTFDIHSPEGFAKAIRGIVERK
jgi:hypothetical protein